MTSSIQRALAAGVFACILSLTLACSHKAVTNSVPTIAPTPAELTSMQPDQVNTAGWDKAWTNLLNVAEQSFTSSLPKLLGVEVELVVGNPGESEEELTLTIVDANERARGSDGEDPDGELGTCNISDAYRRSRPIARSDLPASLDRRCHVWMEIYSRWVRKWRSDI